MEIASIVEKQRAFFMTGATLSYDFRRKALTKLYNAIKLNEPRIASALHADLNKAEQETYMAETGMVLSDLSFAIKHLKRWMKPRHVKTPIEQMPAKSYVVSDPYGVALIMSPWNYPFQLCLEPLTGALAAGNCAVVKPSIYTPETSHLIKELLADIFPEEYVCVVEGGRKENTALLDQRFDYIFFTGSVTVGKLVMEKAAANLTPVSLELGGKSPVIVDSSANIALAAKRIAFGKYINAGQTCVAPDYLLIEKSVRDEFVSEYINAVNGFFPGGDNSSMPVIINDKHYARIMGLISGENAVMGGHGDSERRFIEPTLLVDVSADAPIMQEEIFGPVLPVLTVDSVDSAISFINSRPKPLALYLFTSDKAVGKKVLARVSFGGGCINDTIVHLATPHMGFGGVGESGMGSYHGKLSFDTFTHYKSIMNKSTAIDLPMRYHPYSERSLSLTKSILK